MRWGRLLPWICAATVALGACSSDRSDRDGHQQQTRALFSLRVAPDIPRAAQEAVSAFLEFAADPSASTATHVPFTWPLVLRVNDDGRKLQLNDAHQPSAWLVSDGEGTTSALFVISNSIVNSQEGTAQFLASTRQIPLCNLDQDGPEDMPGGSVYVTREPRGGCADGFRLRLDIDPSATIRAVELVVRAP